MLILREKAESARRGIPVEAAQGASGGTAGVPQHAYGNNVREAAMAASRLHLECLEGRECPATVNLFNGILTVLGTDSADSIIISQSGTTISVAGQSFSAAQVRRIVVSAGQGDDLVRNNTAIAATLYGGIGHDRLIGGSGRDVLYGGQGNDYLNGRQGVDRLIGGSGNDQLVDTLGGDVLNGGSPAPNRGNTSFEAEIIRLVNQERARAGLAPLTVSGRLNQAAYLHTLDMTAISNRYGPDAGHQHTLFGTTRPQLLDRLDAAGYDTWTRSFAFGENIAYGYSSPAEVMAAWMASPGHRANILNPNFTEIGVSVLADASGRLFFTQNFGRLV